MAVEIWLSLLESTDQNEKRKANETNDIAKDFRNESFKLQNICRNEGFVGAENI